LCEARQRGAKTQNRQQKHGLRFQTKFHCKVSSS
jgi:hypothetical protein